jgi:hypothetical protein
MMRLNADLGLIRVLKLLSISTFAKGRRSLQSNEDSAKRMFEIEKNIKLFKNFFIICLVLIIAWRLCPIVIFV